MSYVVSTVCGTCEQVLNPSCNVIHCVYSLWYTWACFEPKLQCHTRLLQSVVHVNEFWTQAAMPYTVSTVCGTHEQVLNLSGNVIHGFYSLWYTWTSFEPEWQRHTWFLQPVVHMNKFWTQAAMSYSYTVSTVCGTPEQVLNPSCNVICGFYSLWYTWTSFELE